MPVSAFKVFRLLTFLSLPTIDRVELTEDLDLKAGDGEELTDAYVNILYCCVEKLQGFVANYPDISPTAIIDEMKKLCDEHETTVTNRFLPEKKKGDAIHCWKAYAPCRRSAIRYGDFPLGLRWSTSSRGFPSRITLFFPPHFRLFAEKARLAYVNAYSTARRSLERNVPLPLELSAQYATSQRNAGKLENSSRVPRRATLSAIVWNLMHSGHKHFTQLSSIIKDLNKKRRSWELESDAGTEPPAPKGALVDRLRVTNDEAERTMEEGRGENKVINSVREFYVKSKL